MYDIMYEIIYNGLSARAWYGIILNVFGIIVCCIYIASLIPIVWRE